MNAVLRLLGSTLAARLALAVILAPIFGLVGAVAAESVPDDRIADNLLEARALKTLVAWEYSRSPLDTTAVHHSECFALSLGLGDAQGTNHVMTAVESPTYRSCPNLDLKLAEYETTGELPAGTPYYRYWHGYSTFSRPALALFGLAGTRWLGFGLVMLAMGALYLGVRQRGSNVAALLLVAPVLFTTDAIIGGLSFLQAFAIGTAWVGGLLCFHLVRREPNWKVAALAGALAGAVSAYIDVLISHPGALTMSVVGAAFGAGVLTNRAALAEWRVPLAATGGWLFGIAWMWASKWLIASMFFGASEVIEDVGNQVAVRLSGSHERVDPSRWLAFTDNVGFWWDRPLTPLVVVACLGVLVFTLSRRWALLDRQAAVSISIVIAIIIIPHVLWYLALSNSSQIHVAIVYRSVALAFGGLAAWTFTALRGATASR